jgi:drug/metabolite transporter (DMT)-like permease
MRVFYTYLFLFVTVFAAAAGDVFVALAMQRIGDLGELRKQHGFIPVVIRVLSSGALFSGIGCMTVAFFSHLAGLSWADLSLMGPSSAALTFVVTAIGARFFLNENVDRRRWIATAFVCAGVLLLTRS